MERPKLQPYSEKQLGLLDQFRDVLPALFHANPNTVEREDVMIKHQQIVEQCFDSGIEGIVLSGIRDQFETILNIKEAMV